MQSAILIQPAGLLFLWTGHNPIGGLARMVYNPSLRLIEHLPLFLDFHAPGARHSELGTMIEVGMIQSMLLTIAAFFIIGLEHWFSSKLREGSSGTR